MRMIKKNNIILEDASPSIFTKNTNNNYKLVPFKSITSHVGHVKYLPAVSKEWKNTIYNFNSNNSINLPVYDLNINSLIKGYFSLYFNSRFLKSKYIPKWKKRKSLNKIFVSKAEVKHTNNKALITVYVYNKERKSLLKKIKQLRSFFFIKNINNFAKKWLKFISVVGSKALSFFIGSASTNLDTNLVLLLKYKAAKKRRYYLNKTYHGRNFFFSKKVRKFFSLVKRLRLRLSLNKNKFEERFLNKLSELVSKYYGKKVEFNIINIKNISHNSDIFTEILTLKVKKEKSSPMRRINSLLAKVVLPKVNRIIERGRIEKHVDYNLIENKYGNTNINFLINKFSVSGAAENNTGVYTQSFKDNLNKLLYNLYYKNIIENSNSVGGALVSTTEFNKSSSSLNKAYSTKLIDIIFENIKYKVMGGARLVVKGRLTKRYRADRAVYKLKWKGGLKNIDSSFKGLSTVVFRGYLDSNVERSKLNSKRRIGSFGVKSWFSGK